MTDHDKAQILVHIRHLEESLQGLEYAIRNNMMMSAETAIGDINRRMVKVQRIIVPQIKIDNGEEEN